MLVEPLGVVAFEIPHDNDTLGFHGTYTGGGTYGGSTHLGILISERAVFGSSTKQITLLGAPVGLGVKILYVITPEPFVSLSVPVRLWLVGPTVLFSNRRYVTVVFELALSLLTVNDTVDPFAKYALVIVNVSAGGTYGGAVNAK